MTKDEATLVMTDVALHRAPHTRAEIKMAKEVLEPAAGPGEVDPSDEVHRAEAAVAAQVQADARLARANVDLNAAQARADDAKAQAAAVNKPAPVAAAEPVLSE